MFKNLRQLSQTNGRNINTYSCIKNYIPLVKIVIQDKNTLEVVSLPTPLSIERASDLLSEGVI
jgi:hypothetical protein